MPSLEQELSLRFQLRTHRFDHGHFHVELIGPLAPDDLIDVSEFNVDERLPYWAELWPSARALAAEMLDRPPPAGSVLELGCGLALPSLALRSRGAQVVASDYYPEALEFARANAARNGIMEPATLLLDWRTPPPSLRPYDLVIAADVLYERRNAEVLVPLLPRITSSAGTVLLADPGRAHLPHFRKLLEGAGWRVEEIGIRMAPGPVEGRQMEIRLLSLTR